MEVIGTGVGIWDWGMMGTGRGRGCICGGRNGGCGEGGKVEGGEVVGMGLGITVSIVDGEGVKGVRSEVILANH